MASFSTKGYLDYKCDKEKSRILLETLETFLDEIIDPDPVNISIRQDKAMEYHAESVQFFPSLITSCIQIAIALIMVQIILKLCKTKS